jgi:hypothetical protein
MPELSLLTHEYFEPLVDQSFLVTAEGQELALRTLEVRMLPPPKRRTLTGKVVAVSAQRLPFSVYFRSEGTLALRQGTYRLAPPGGGVALDIFIVPLGIEDDGMIYEAVFN